MNNIAQLKAFLKASAPIPDDVFNETISLFQELSLAKGDFFIQQGEICRQAAFIHTGLLRSYYYNNRGDEVTYCFCSANNLTTSFKSFITQTASSLAMQAMEATELLVITYDDLQYLYKHFPIWQQIGRVATEREYLVLESYASTLNNETAREKYQRLLKEHPSIIQKVPLQYIASYLGISKETLSRIRKQTVQ